MDQVRLGVIGCGGMAQNHMKGFAEIKNLKFTAASDNFPDNLNRIVQQYGVKGFASGEEMLDSGLVDAVLIATPHYFHPDYSIAAFQRGVHVLTEKPVSVTAKAAEAANREHQKRPDLMYAVMYQMRTTPRWAKAREIIQSGQLGDLQRVHWTATNWFRSQAYYDSGAWRATWAGEGGGVLLNQCPHNLDLLWWLTGMPHRVTAFIGVGKYHRIEVEDEVTAYLEYPNGATGLFVTSTGEAPGSDYMEIVGDRGRLAIHTYPEQRLELFQTRSSVREHTYKTAARFGGMEVTKMTIEAPAGGGHKIMMDNFVQAILAKDPSVLVAPAEEGIYSVELANAMIMSGLRREPIDLPMDREGYEVLLKQLIEQAAAKKQQPAPPEAAAAR